MILLLEGGNAFFIFGKDSVDKIIKWDYSVYIEYKPVSYTHLDVYKRQALMEF